MLSLLYLVVRALVHLLASGGQRGRDDGSKDLEILVLRHQLRMLHTKFSWSFDAVVRSEGATGILTPIRAPNANAHAERVIATIRAECLDWTLILGRRHLDRTLRTYAEHYNRARPIAPSLSPHRSPKPGTRSRSALEMFAGGTCWAGSSTSTTDSPHDRIWVFDPHELRAPAGQSSS